MFRIEEFLDNVKESLLILNWTILRHPLSLSDFLDLLCGGPFLPLDHIEFYLLAFR